MDARDWDILFGNRHHGGSLRFTEATTSDGFEALEDILKRSRAVLQDKASFNPYTVRFATYCVQNYRDPDTDKFLMEHFGIARPPRAGREGVHETVFSRTFTHPPLSAKVDNLSTRATLAEGWLRLPRSSASSTFGSRHYCEI